MFDHKRLIQLIGPLGIGLGIGCLGWMITAAPRYQAGAALVQSTAALARPVVHSRPAAETADLLAMAIFSPPLQAEREAGASTGSRPPSTLRLVGISVTPRRRAALISAGGERAVWVPEGAEGQGFTVDQVTGSSVTVSVSGVAQTLVLFPQSQAAAPEAPTSAQGGELDTAAETTAG